MVAKQWRPVGDRAPKRFDEPACILQRIEQLPARVTQAETILDKIQNRNSREIAGALDKVGCAYDPFESGYTGSRVSRTVHLLHSPSQFCAPSWSTSRMVASTLNRDASYGIC